jgi:hypothetical protein
MPLARGLAEQFDSGDLSEALPVVIDAGTDAPQIAELLATIDQLKATVAEQASQLNELAGPAEWLALRACDRGGYTCETLRKWCETGVILSRRHNGRLFVNTRSLAAHLARLGLAKAIRSA